MAGGKGAGSSVEGAGAAAEMTMEELWLAYKHRQDGTAREELIVRHLHLVHTIAGRMVMHLPAMVDLDDLISYGTFGLLDAVEKFDYSRGIKFETYAYTRIQGAILDGLRAMDWVPQSVRKRAREVESMYWQLQHRLGRPATDDEMAEAMDMTPDEFADLILRLSATTLLSLEDVVGGEDEGDGSLSLGDLLADPDSPDPLAAAQVEDARAQLARAVAALPDREQLVISLYYYNGLTVKEIGEVLNLSASRISQIHSKAVLRLRAYLGEEARLLAE